MTLPELLSLPIAGKQVLIVGRPGSGKTWLAKQLDPHDFDTLHTDDYLVFNQVQALQAIIEDIGDREGRTKLIEGILGYKLLLWGACELSYRPDLVIICDISAGRQREIYLKERDLSKLQFLKRFHVEHLSILEQYYRIVPENERPQIIEFQNNWNYATEQQ